MADFITLLDPSIQDHQGNNSNNLGDLVIYESVLQCINELFPGKEIIRISSHDFLEKKHFDILKIDNLKFFGGTNILSSDVSKYHQWKLSESADFFINPHVRNLILFGVGWWQYQDSPNVITQTFYRHILSNNYFHSVRDEYTKERLINMGIPKTINTSCPTTWGLHGVNGNRKDVNIKNCLFMLTDFNFNSEFDNELVKIIIDHYSGEIYFFPQGDLDIECINSLPIYKENKNKIKLLPRTIDEFSSLLKYNDINFIGTRLHGGIKCLQNKIDTIIIAIDNRAKEIGKDINLPVIDRFDYTSLKQWIEGKEIFKKINLNIEGIHKWKNQFNHS